MKSTIFFLTTFAASALAQDREDFFPECALDCLDAAVVDATDCADDDAWCQCIQSNYEAIYDSGVNCVMQDCGPDTAIAEVLPAGVNFCSAATIEHESETAAPSETNNSQSPSATTSSPPAETTDDTDSDDEDEEEEAAASETDTPDAAHAVAPLGTFGVLIAGILAVL